MQIQWRTPSKTRRCGIHMAASGCPGVFVAFNRKVILGCRASKVRTMSFDAFESINYPYVGEISSLGLHPQRKSDSKKGIFRPLTAYSDKVFLLKLYPGMDLSILDYLREKGCRGVYVEGFGLGGMPFLKNDFIGAAKRAVGAGMVVLAGSQCRYEGSSLSVYETAARLWNAVLQAYDMTAEAAITKLMWVLWQTDDQGDSGVFFCEHCRRGNNSESRGLVVLVSFTVTETLLLLTYPKIFYNKNIKIE